MIPYIRLLTLPTGPHNPHTLTEHHLVNANKSFSRDQLVREEGVKLGRGGSEEGKKAEERVKVLLESGEEGVEDVNHGRYHTRVASRVHARLCIKNRQILLTDLGSVNGTYILWSSTSSDGSNIGKNESYRVEMGKGVPLKDKDIITLGDSSKIDPANRKEHQPIRVRVIFSDEAKADIDNVVDDPAAREVNDNVVIPDEVQTEIKHATGRYALHFDSDDEEGYTTESPRKDGAPLDDSSDGIEIHTPIKEHQIKDQIPPEVAADADVWSTDSNHGDDRDRNISSFFVPEVVFDKPIEIFEVDDGKEREEDNEAISSAHLDDRGCGCPILSHDEAKRQAEEEDLAYLKSFELPTDFWEEGVDGPSLPAEPVIAIAPLVDDPKVTDDQDQDDDPQFLRMSHREIGNALAPYQVYDDDDDDQEEEEDDDDYSDQDAIIVGNGSNLDHPYEFAHVQDFFTSPTVRRDEDLPEDYNLGADYNSNDGSSIDDRPASPLVPTSSERRKTIFAEFAEMLDDELAFHGNHVVPVNGSSVRATEGSETSSDAGYEFAFHGNHLLPINGTSVGATVGSDCCSEGCLEGSKVQGQILTADGEASVGHDIVFELHGATTAFEDLMATFAEANDTATGSKRKRLEEDEEVAMASGIESSSATREQVPVKRRKLDGRDVKMLGAGMALGATGVVAALLYAA